MLITIKTSSNKDQFTKMEEAFFFIKKKKTIVLEIEG